MRRECDKGNMTKRIRMMKIPVVFSILALCLTGCGSRERIEKVRVTVPEYEKVAYEVVEVQRGDITPVLSLRLTADSFQTKSYYALYDEMEIDSVNVAVGDEIKPGDVLISFKAGDVDTQIEKYQSQVEQNNLLIEHYTKLSQLDSTVDYSEDLKRLAEDTRVANLYIQELQARLDSYNICAEDYGSVYLLSDILDYGIVGTSNNLITVIYRNNRFTTETTDDYDFVVGETYMAVYGVAEYELVLADIEEGGKDANGDTVRKLIFEGKEGTNFSSRDKLTLTINKPVIQDVIYVPQSCVFDVDEKYYVYLLDENGFREAVNVEIGDVMGEYIVIQSGLNEGDRVVMQ